MPSTEFNAEVVGGSSPLFIWQFIGDVDNFTSIFGNFGDISAGSSAKSAAILTMGLLPPRLLINTPNPSPTSATFAYGQSLLKFRLSVITLLIARSNIHGRLRTGKGSNMWRRRIEIGGGDGGGGLYPQLFDSQNSANSSDSEVKFAFIFESSPSSDLVNAEHAAKAARLLWRQWRRH